jgi:shikimate dehydrogenase
MRCGLLGRKLGHSYSKQIHEKLFAYSYDLLEAEPEELERLIRPGGFDGVNVTIPYKQPVMQFCSALSPAAAMIGSVNTLVIGRDGNILGHNTDYDGFCYLAERAGVDLRGKKVLILGSGGTSRTARQAAADLGAAEIVIVSRGGENNYDNLGLHADAQVLVNTTPVGMYPQNDGIPVDLTRFPKLTGVLDVVYNPLTTGLVRRSRELCIPASNGLPMLVRQAVAAGELFTGEALPAQRTEEVLREMQRELQTSSSSECRAAAKRAWDGHLQSF